MEKSETIITRNKKNQFAGPRQGMSSSPGDSSVSETPKDLLPGQAAARDLTERNIHSDNLDERQEALLDEANDLSFPASDPISVSSFTRIEVSSTTSDIIEEGSMTIVVPNTRPNEPRVTLFGQLDDGNYAASILDEGAVPYTRYWDNAIDQAVVYIEPDEDQLQRMLTALNEGILEFSQLQEFGSSNGGTSIIIVS